MADQKTYYVKRVRWQVCEDANQRDRYQPHHCLHRPRCTMGQDGLFGRERTGWTRVRGSNQANREVRAWQSAGWTAALHPATPEIRAEVRAWQKQAKGYPGES
jgi:hypothetical protein